ncbi:MAG: tetratricopeptide repeat protein [Ruminococcaceae bacterium]|nr:tetratricopeptide repeat protein [Oscillospiraceae bacterium]
MRRIIKIFLASSLVEFSVERMVIENFIRNISDSFEEKYDIKIQPLLCENFDTAYSIARKQEEYNEKICESEMCFFIFFTKAGEYTREEFEVARKRFEETGKPKIYTYFKTLKPGEGEQSVYDFMEELDKIFGHYYGTFDHIDTVKLRILLSLRLREMDFLEITNDGDKCFVDGKAVMSLNNVAEFVNNKELASLQNQLAETEKEYYEMKPIYAKGDCDEAFYRRYCAVASKRETLIEEIEQLQKAIFNVSLRMSADETHGEITERQKQAYRLFEVGDYEGCMAVLDAEEIKNDFLLRRKRLKEQDTALCKRFIRENKTAIDILEVMTDYAGRFEEIAKRYEDIVPLALEEGIELETVYCYIDYLYKQNNGQKALEVAQSLDSCGAWNEKDDFKKSELYNLLALIYSSVNNIEKGEKYHLLALSIREELVKSDAKRYSYALACSYNNIGVFYKNQDKAEKTEDYYLKAVKIYEDLAVKNPEKFSYGLAGCYNNTAFFYKEQGDFSKAEQYYNKAVTIRETLSRFNYQLYGFDLAASYNGMAVFYAEQDNPQKAEEYYLKAIGIYEEFAKTNPQRYSYALAGCNSNLGSFYREQGEISKAEECLLKAFEIHKALVKLNPEKYSPDLAMSYNNLGNVYSEMSEEEKAKGCYNQAIEIYEIFVKLNPGKYTFSLIKSYNGLGIVYYNQHDHKNAEEYYLKAITMLENIAEQNYKKYYPYLMRCYNNIIRFYKKQADFQKFEVYYIKKTELTEKFAAFEPERYNPDLADRYCEIADYYNDIGREQEAKEYYLKAIALYELLAEKHPKRYNPDLAACLFNYAVITEKDEYFERALQIALTQPENDYCKQIIGYLKN